MSNVNDRRGAVKLLKNLVCNSKTEIEVFRKRFDDSFNTVFLPNGVENSPANYGGIECDVLSPVLYASNRVMIYIHGGCFSGGSKKAYRSLCSSLAAKCCCRVIVPEFRLAPSNPYPAAPEDIQGVFRSVFTEEQVACSLDAKKGTNSLPEIIICADGSGASIACSLIFNLREKYRSCIKQIVFFSPWLNLSPDSKLLTTRKICDEVMSGDVLRKASMDYTFAGNLKSPFVSPVFAEDSMLKNFPPVFIQMGEKEILLEDAKLFSKKLLDSKNKCVLDVWPKMMFMFQMADEFLNESHLALDKIGQIVTKNFGGESLTKSIKIENKPKLEYGTLSEA